MNPWTDNRVPWIRENHRWRSKRL